MTWDGTPAAHQVVQAGTGTCQFTASATSAVTTVAFAQAYQTTPTVVATQANADLILAVTSVSATGFTAQMTRPAGAITFTAAFRWVAVGTA